MKHVVQFESWSHLLELLSQGHSNSVDLAEISAKMAAQNALDKVEIEKQWDRVFAKMVPNRNRTRYTSHLYS
jgi:PIN domain nuclease of toxin-antitoxin system